MHITHGVRQHCEEYKAYWILNLIWSYQPQCAKDRMLREIQFWRLTVRPDKTATIRCDRDTGNTAITQEIEFTDHPAGDFRFWVENAVVMLPEER
ncbi:MAG TPA: hypothetical protein VGP72_06440 [Planctomycetota bacterium]|jgi:hypothetical protein